MTVLKSDDRPLPHFRLECELDEAGAILAALAFMIKVGTNARHNAPEVEAAIVRVAQMPPWAIEQLRDLHKQLSESLSDYA